MRRVRPVLVSLAVVAAGLTVVPGQVASAAEPTVTFTTPGEHVYTVPAGVTRVDVVAVGGAGGNSVNANGGRAGRIAATLDVAPGQTLYAQVGSSAVGSTPGVNGGGAAGGAAGQCVGTPGAGGGASDVRTVALGETGSAGSRVLVAGGGGGAATSNAGDGPVTQAYGGHRGSGGGGGGSAHQGGFGAVDGVGAESGTGLQPDSTSTDGGRGGVGAAGAGSGCGGGGGGGFGGGGGGAAGSLGGGGGGGGSLVPGGFPAGMALRTDAPSVTFSAPGLPAPAGPLRTTIMQSFKQNSQFGGTPVPFTNCPSSCSWWDGDFSGPPPGSRGRDVGYTSTQGWGSSGVRLPDFNSTFLSVRPGPAGAPAALGEPFLLSNVAHYNEPNRFDSPTSIGLQTLLRVQPPSGPEVVFRLLGPDTIPVAYLDTDNTPPCDPSIQVTGTPCDDIVTLDDAYTRTTTAGGLTWRFELLGWRTPAGTFVKRFVTEEAAVNQRDLYARITVDTVPTASTLTVDATVPASPVLSLTTTPVPQTGGTVSFTDGGAPVAGCTEVPVDAVDGVTTCSPAGLSAAVHVFGARFGGGVGYAASEAVPVTYPVIGAAVATGTTLTGPATGVVGRSASFTAAVSPDPGGGTVAFTDGGAVVAGCEAVAVTSGSAVCTTSALAVGPHVLTAAYGGAPGFGPSSSAALEHTVTAADTATTTTLAGPATGVAGQPVSFVATVAPAPGGGTVAFRDGTTVITGCEAVAVASGSATCTTSALGAGAHTLTAVFSGAAGFAGSVSAALTHTVSAPDVCSAGAPVPAGYKVIRGTDRDDRLAGTTGNDIVFAGAGKDSVATLGGADIVCGGDGDDSVSAGAGNDQVFGGAGNDSLVGEDGDDVLFGGPGSDRLVGGNGTDRGIDPDPGTVRVGIESST